jgi:hypothetical protein
LYLRKSYDNKVQLFSDLVEKLNEALSNENASVDRIISRIDQTPIEEVKQRLKQPYSNTNQSIQPLSMQGAASTK